MGKKTVSPDLVKAQYQYIRTCIPPGDLLKISGWRRSCQTRSNTGASTIASPDHCNTDNGAPNRKHEITTDMNCRNVITEAKVTAPKQKMVYEIANCETAALTLSTKTS